MKNKKNPTKIEEKKESRDHHNLFSVQYDEKWQQRLTNPTIEVLLAKQKKGTYWKLTADVIRIGPFT